MIIFSLYYENIGGDRSEISSFLSSFPLSLLPSFLPPLSLLPPFLPSLFLLSHLPSSLYVILAVLELCRAECPEFREPRSSNS